MNRYIVRKPGVTVAGRDYRPGDSIEAKAADVQHYVADESLEPVDGATHTSPAKAPTPAATKSVAAGDGATKSTKRKATTPSKGAKAKSTKSH